MGAAPGGLSFTLFDESLDALREGAACRGMDTSLFFDLGGTHSARPARRVCQGCPVRVECFIYALETAEHRMDYGVWGGTTCKDRIRFRQGFRLGHTTQRRAATREEVEEVLAEIDEEHREPTMAERVMGQGYARREDEVAWVAEHLPWGTNTKGDPQRYSPEYQARHAVYRERYDRKKAAR